MIHTEFDIEVDPQRVAAMLERVAKVRPLTGERLERPPKSLYPTPQATSFKAARLAAEALIARRKGEQKS